MAPSLFRKFCRIAREHGGIAVGPGKEALVAARVGKRQRALGIPTPRKYLRFLEADESGSELCHFVDVITTNFTSFLREPEHFTILSDHLRRLVAAGADRLRMWSAACASGEEPYSMAITALDALNGNLGQEIDLKILATDISCAVLQRASDATYSAERVGPLTRAQRLRHFDRLGRRGSPDEAYRVRPRTAAPVVFKRLNLARPPFPMRGPLDAVFCRNVMIYFDQEARQGLIDEVSRLLAPGGLLMVGHSEPLAGVRHRLQCLGSAVYRKPLPTGVLTGHR